MKIHRKYWLGAVLLLLVMALCFFVKPAYHLARVMRARWMVQNLYYDEHDTTSFSKIRTALELAPNDLTVLRKACEIYGELNFTIGYIQWLQLLQHGEVTVADYGLFLDFLIDEGQPVIFRPYAARLATNVRPDEIKLVLAKYHIVMNNTSVAGLLLEELYRSESKTAEVCYLLGLTLLQQGWYSERGEASKFLQESIRISERFRDESVKLLIQNRLLEEDEMEQIIDVLNGSAGDIRQLLLAYSLKASASPDASQKVMETVRQEFRKSEADTKLEVGRWMNQNRQYQETVDFIDKSEALVNRDLFLVWVDAMAAGNRWQELEELFKGEVPVTREIQELFRFRIFHELGKPNMADVFWNKSLDLAQNKPVLLWYYSGYAARLGLQVREESAYRALLPITAHKRGAYLALVEMLDESGQTLKLFDLLAAMKKEYPNDDEVANDWAYCALLLEKEVESVGDQVRAVLEQSPEVMAYRVTYGLYLLRMNQAKAAWSLFDSIALPPYQDWLLEWRVVYLAILQRNQLRDQAAEVMATIPIHQLKQEEARLLGL